jgi:tetratricopeptide (TPR) repeat protein
LLKQLITSLVWNLHEQVVIAALDEGDEPLAHTHLQAIMKRFPKSERTFRLMGMENESKGKYLEALEIYEYILKDNPANIQAMKRKVS